MNLLQKPCIEFSADDVDDDETQTQRTVPVEVANALSAIDGKYKCVLGHTIGWVLFLMKRAKSFCVGRSIVDHNRGKTESSPMKV